MYTNPQEKTPYTQIHNSIAYAGKSLARPTSRCILFDGENISFDASVIYINSTSIPPVMIIIRIYETQNSLL